MIWAFVISPIGRWIVGGAALLVLLFFAYRWVVNGAYERGQIEGTNRGLKQAEEVNKKAWDEREKEIQKQTADLLEQRQHILEDQRVILETRKSLQVDFNRALSSIRTRAQVDTTGISRVPVSELDSAIRQSLADLRSAP